MATDQDDPCALHEIIAEALTIADARPNHLVAALLAQCLEALGERDPDTPE